MGLDPFSSASVSTPHDPNVLFSKADCPPVVDAEIKERVLRAHGKLIHMAIWALPDLALTARTIPTGWYSTVFRIPTGAPTQAITSRGGNSYGVF